MSDGWWAEARCRGLDPEIFHPPRGVAGHQDELRAFCAGCPVRAECLEYAVTTCQRGVWGGTTDKQRRKLRRLRIKSVPLREEKDRDIA